MKKIWNKTILTLLSVFLCLMAVSEKAYATGSCIVTSSDTARPGTSVVISVSLGADGLYGFQGRLVWSDNLTLKSVDQVVGGKWDLGYNEQDSLVVGNDLAMSTPLNDRTTVFTARFDISSKADVGDTVSVSFHSIEGTVGDNATSISIEGDSWERQLTGVLSGDNNLSSLSCSNATLSPAFSSGTTSYSCSVPYSVGSLDLKFGKSEPNATVTISGNSLVVGQNTVTVAVKAANGSTKYYTISVTRGQDPNYKPSNDASLKTLTIEGTTLSPKFQPEVLEYVAYVPYETEKVTLHGEAASEKADTVKDVEVDLNPEGDTVAKIQCAAEDKTTTRIYTVHVYRMPVYQGGDIAIAVTDPHKEEAQEMPPEEPAEPETPSAKIPLKITLPLVGEVSTLLTGGIALAVIVILLFILGFLIGRTGRTSAEDEEDDPEEEIDPTAAWKALQASKVTQQPAYELKKEEPKENPAKKVPLKEKEERQPAATAAPAAGKPAPIPSEKKTAGIEKQGKAPLPKKKEATPAPRGAKPLTQQEKEKAAADKAAAEMSLDELLKDIRDM